MSKIIEKIQKTLKDADEYTTLYRQMNNAQAKYSFVLPTIYGRGLVGQPRSGACLHVFYTNQEECDAWSENTAGTSRCKHLDKNDRCKYAGSCPYKEKNQAVYDAWAHYMRLSNQVDSFNTKQTQQVK